MTFPRKEIEVLVNGIINDENPELDGEKLKAAVAIIEETWNAARVVRICPDGECPFERAEAKIRGLADG